MPKLPILSSKEIIKALRKAGFEHAPKRGKGSHTALFKKAEKKIQLVIIPHNKQIPKGTLLAILEQAGISKDELMKFLK
jgi:predicted RNA binding protein YcfA (HicA-like mRNA interferase family)